MTTHDDTAIAICTSNEGKRAECERILGVPLVSAPAEIDEIQGIDAEVVCRDKAARAYMLLGRPVIVDDTGLGLSALGGFPGALVTWATGAGGNEILHRMLPDGAPADAEVVTAIGFADAAGVHVFVGRSHGTVLPQPRGSHGFGFDEIFVPEGETRSLAEMDAGEKDAISPRGQALAALAAFLNSRPDRTG